MKTRPRTRLIAALALAGGSTLLLAACSTPSGGSGSHDMSGMDMPSSTSTTSGSQNAQDVSFAQGMAMHHLQAIEMADVLLAKHGVDARVTSLAREIKAAQQPEIEEMNGWLSSWGETTVTASMGAGHAMSGMGDGMMSEADMTALKDASGSTASSLFLTQMVEHHRGAVAMARTEQAAGRDPRAVALADSIVTSQTAQIADMQQLLKRL
ncbi:DUF305 domain-containing protein [uncultured Amnibacterium sp.]|uniref:DUF305 domain-containing protein n=1 Tax=uncultured Amnibacterium sp. TaxID=1631851 RepID=UPI0035CB185F